MNKETLIKKTEDIISLSDYRSLLHDYSDWSSSIEFKDDSGVRCTIDFGYRAFGIVSYLTLRRDYVEILRFKITKDEYRNLSKRIDSRINQIKEQELGMVFKDVTRDNKLKGMLDGE